MKHTKKKILSSVIALTLCLSMLLGSTFAWFTDSVSSKGNKIQSGNLEVDLQLLDKNGNWSSLKENNDPIWDAEANKHWEPGYTDVKIFKVVNQGNLSLKWKAAFTSESELSILADVIDVYVKAWGVLTDEQAEQSVAYPADRDLDGYTHVGTLRKFVNSIESTTYGSLEKGESAYLAIALKMQEGAGNDYKNRTIGSFDIHVVATQKMSESDSFGDDYDSLATFPGDFAASTTVNVENGEVKEPATVGDPDGSIHAEIPAGVKVENGVDSLQLTVNSLSQSGSNITATNRSEFVHSVDVHIEGVSADNTVPMVIALDAILPTGLNDNNVKLYHVENGATVEMTLVDNPTNHNEFSYDPANGNVVIAIASFSEIVVYGDTDAGWDGKTATEYTVKGDTIEIANAQQFAYFRDRVDEGTDFAGKTVVLTADINLNGHNFDPIGWGYDNEAWNRNQVAGKVFKGTFDGGNNTISGLYQNGWDLDPDKENYSNYTYTNCGGGLFAAALDATFKNLTIDGADIVFECVEIGVLVGLAQGNCTFENINITGCKIANYQRPTGGVVGEVSPKIENGVAVDSTHIFNNVYVDSNTVIGTLWGDFDGPCGGVIGAYWDDANKTKVEMKYVTVAARLDVYNDVTSTYQWYAYRRAGMLVGNTDHADGHTATAPFLSCNNVTVYYGDWANYHYCEFNKANPNWPWVRVEPGENCNAYSNPRWGRPIDSTTGQPVTDSVHSHGEGEGHLQLIEFHQLYGGGQGVYGEAEHNGVEEGIYTVTYMDHGEILHVDYITDNDKAYDCEHDTENAIWPVTNVKDANNNTPSYWVKADNTQFSGVGAGNTANVIVYPKWPNEYTVRCLDTYGNVAYYNFVIDDKATDAEYEAIATDINNTLVNIQNEVDKDKKVMVIVWEKEDGSTLTNVTATDIKNSVESTKEDFILTAVPQLQETSINLEPYYDPTTGELVAYHVTEVNQDDTNSNVIIPDYVGDIPVTVINQSAAAGFANLHSITIPNTITSIGKNAFASGDIFGNGETITIYYEGTREQWEKYMADTNIFEEGWDYGIGTGSRIFFLDENGKVDTQQGYLEVVQSGNFWNATYSWNHKTDLSAVKNEYTGYCNCTVSTKGDTSHIYVDGNGTVMGRNDEGTPVNENGDVIEFEDGGWFGEDKLTDGTNTYYRYRPDAAYWEGVVIE